MIIKEFAGIRSFHDGLSVSDYCNMVPLEASCIDRLGEKLVVERGDTQQRIIQTFVDSKKNVYIATTKSIIRLLYVGDNQWEVRPLEAAWGGPFNYIDGESRTIEQVTFCESTTKPSQIFMCDSRYVYYWNTSQLVSDEAMDSIQTAYPSQDFYKRVKAYVVSVLPLGAFTGFNTGLSWNIYDVRDEDATTGFRYGWFPMVYNGTWQPLRNNYVGSLWECTSIAWYENRLVVVTKSDNTVRLSRIRPDRWLIPTQGTNDQRWLPFQIFWNDDQDKPAYNFVPHAYISTASSASLQDVVSFAGQLYFLNDTSIELWTNTYNEDAPIQQNTMSTIHFGGRSPCVVADKMYLICKDNWHNDFIAAISQNGQATRLSNDEIEKRIAGRAAIIRPLSVRDNSFIVVYCDDGLNGVDLTSGLSVTREGKWWTYNNRYVKNHTFAAWSVLTMNGEQFDVGNHGEFIKQDRTSRLHVDGSPILRFIRGCFTQLPVRGIVREIEVVCDTGVNFDNERGKMYARISFDRGLSFGPYLYRTLGAPGKNDRCIIWRNCGSGNSFLLEFGTSDNVRFQLYQIGLEIG